MRSSAGSSFLRARRAVQDGFDNLRQRFAAAPVMVKVVTVAALLIIASLIGLHPTKLFGVIAAVLPFAVVAGAHAGSLGRWLIPCRTVAWALLWAVPVLFLVSLIPSMSPLISVALAWALALVVLGWRLAKSMQVGRDFGREQSRAAALAAPHAGTLPRTPPRQSRPGV